MGNNVDGGFQQLPRVYLRDLRKKTEKRFRSVEKEKERGHYKEKKEQQISDETQLNTKNVSEYIISNPDFLDDLVKNHIAQDRVRAWIRQPTEEESVGADTVSETGLDDNDEQDETSQKDAEREWNEEEDPKDESSKSKEDLPRIERKASPGKDARPARRNTRNSRRHSAFEEYMSQKDDRHQKLLMINRSRLVFPFMHATDDLSELINTTHADVTFDEMESHLFPYTELSSDDINKAFIKMVGNLFGKYGFPMTELCYFLTTMKANYLDVEYHNYSHALSHAQSMFWILKKNPGVFTELEMKALMIACIAHDVGHPGVNETYLKSVHGGMQRMYDDPILENHHTQTCLLILQEIKCNVFCDLNSHDYKQVLDDIKFAILSTNVHRYRVQCERVRQIMEIGIDLEKQQHRQSLKSLLMMACDLCSSWKRWEEHRNIVWSLYKEFFNQGDKELEFGLDSPPVMMRTNADHIPKFQTSFLEDTVLPICQLLSNVFPCVDSAVQCTKDNLDCWKTYG